MYADNKILGLGGSITKGAFALCLPDGLYRGSSVVTETYQNEILSKKKDFICHAVEIWCLDSFSLDF